MIIVGLLNLCNKIFIFEEADDSTVQAVNIQNEILAYFSSIIANLLKWFVVNYQT